MPGDAQSARDSTASAEADLLPHEQDEALQHQMELKQSLRDLRAASNATTARLDNTYYSVLEKFSTLQQSVATLQELCSMARRLNDDFVVESEHVTKEVREQLDTLEDFSEQQTAIEGLQARINASRERSEGLSRRADTVRQRAEAWSHIESKWEERTRQRIKVFWGISAAILVVLIGLLVFQYTPAGQVAEVLKDLNLPDHPAGIIGG